jgi:hypothetical protein
VSHDTWLRAFELTDSNIRYRASTDLMYPQNLPTAPIDRGIGGQGDWGEKESMPGEEIAPDVTWLMRKVVLLMECDMNCYTY